MFKRVLIANRGEIAIRIARAADALGVESVAVYAPIDALALHTRLRTQALEIGAGSSTSGDPVRAYLDIEAIIAAAKASGADCIHPGYGFQSAPAITGGRIRRWENVHDEPAQVSIRARHHWRANPP